MENPSAPPPYQVPPIITAPVAKKRGPWVLISLVILLIVGGGVVSYLFILSHKTADTSPQSVPQPSQSPPSFMLQKVDDSPQSVESYFNHNDSNSLLSVIYHQLPDSSWLANIDKPLKIVYLPISNGSPAELFNSQMALCQQANPTSCAEYNFSQNYYIAFDTKQKQAQPYVKLSYLVRILRAVYRGSPSSVNAIEDKPCTRETVDAITWEAKFWQSLAPEKKAPLGGFDNSGINREEAKVSHYLLGKPDSSLDQIVKNRCVQDYTLQASSSAQITTP